MSNLACTNFTNCFQYFKILDGYGLDKEYRDVYSKLRSNDDYECMDTGDTPPSDSALYCRRYFKELQLSNPK